MIGVLSKITAAERLARNKSILEELYGKRDPELTKDEVLSVLKGVRSFFGDSDG